MSKNKILISYLEKFPTDPAALEIGAFGTFGDYKTTVVSPERLEEIRASEGYDDVRVICENLPWPYTDAEELYDAVLKAYNCIANGAPSSPNQESLKAWEEAADALIRILKIERFEKNDGVICETQQD